MVCVDDIERVVLVVELVHIASREGHIVDALGRGVVAGLSQHLFREVDSDYLSGRNRPRQADCYRARAATGVKQAHSGGQMRQQKPGIHLGAAAGMILHYGFVMPMRIAVSRNVIHLCIPLSTV